MFSRAIVCSVVIVLALVCVASAQTCKNAATPFQPAACVGCTTCTGTSSSCCDAAYDSYVANVIAMARLLDPSISDKCVDTTKTQMCAVCDPKNQDFLLAPPVYTKFYSINSCKSTCLEYNTICPKATFDCSTFNETNCWTGVKPMISTSDAQSKISTGIIGVVITFLMVVFSL